MLFGVYYDLRNPDSAARTYEDFYAEVLEQVAVAEQLGFHQAWVSEHHFCDDGYTPSPMIWATAFGTATVRMRVGTNLVVLPLHEPLRIAEDSATLSLLTRGRFDLGVGGGYREHEFAAHGRNMRHRPSLMEEGVEVIRQAWSGRPLDFTGKRFSYDGVTVQPVPQTPPTLWMGGTSANAVDRAARIADGFLATADEHIGMYVDALARHGRDASEGRVVAGKWAVIADDPEREWARVGEHVLYQVNDYIAHQAFGPGMAVMTSPQQVLDSGLYALWDGPTAVEEFVRQASEYPQIEQFKVWTLMPGEPVSAATERLEYLAKAVVPEVERRLASTVAG